MYDTVCQPDALFATNSCKQLQTYIWLGVYGMPAACPLVSQTSCQPAWCLPFIAAVGLPLDLARCAVIQLDCAGAGANSHPAARHALAIILQAHCKQCTRQASQWLNGFARIGTYRRMYIQAHVTSEKKGCRGVVKTYGLIQEQLVHARRKNPYSTGMAAALAAAAVFFQLTSVSTQARHVCPSARCPAAPPGPFLAANAPTALASELRSRPVTAVSAVTGPGWAHITHHSQN